MPIPVMVTYKGDYDEPVILIGTYVLSSETEVERLQQAIRSKFPGYLVGPINSKDASVEDVIQELMFDSGNTEE